MGLWLKCPACQARNSLDAKVCAACGASLDHLPMEKRVYLLEPGGSTTPAAATPPAPAEAPQAPPPRTVDAPVASAKPAKVSKRSKKKK